MGQWIIRINSELDKLASGGGTRERTMYRVPKPLREVKQKDFEPSLISFGLYNRDPSQQLTPTDVCRMKVAHAFLETLEKTRSDFDEISKQVVPNPEESRELYDEIASNTMTTDEVRWLLTLDAIFLTSLYIDLVLQNRYPKLQKAVSNVHASLHVDVLMLENQIPLPLIRNVLKILLKKTSDTEAHDSLKSFCKEVIGKYSRSLSIPGLDKDYTHAENVIFGSSDTSSIHTHAAENMVLEGDHMHLLDVLYKTICSGVGENEEYFGDPGKFTPLKTASQLHAAGITFKGGAIGISEVKFEAGWFTGTLHLPKLAVDTTTEKLWRNIVAFENVRSTSRQHEFMCYLELMDDLIDTDADVRLLRRGKDPVICQIQLGNEKEVAHMFNTLRQNCSTSRSKKWNQLRSSIMAHYDKPYIKLLVEFQDKYISKPWIFVGGIAATVLLVLTFFQTLYTMMPYYESPNSPIIIGPPPV